MSTSGHSLTSYLSPLHFLSSWRLLCHSTALYATMQDAGKVVLRKNNLFFLSWLLRSSLQGGVWCWNQRSSWRHCCMVHIFVSCINCRFFSVSSFAVTWDSLSTCLLRTFGVLSKITLGFSGLFLEVGLCLQCCVSYMPRLNNIYTTTNRWLSPFL